MAAAVITQAPSRPGAVPNPLWRVLQNGLAKDPAERYPRCAGFADALMQESATGDDGPR